MREEDGTLPGAADAETLIEENRRLREELDRLQAENAKLRGVIRSRAQETMSTRLKDALRE
ncbi:hypothetical protein [Paenibacillus methanolicus]|uniref:Uncharacterized protein n=1 Tax=Paenibacillus methanolicus TaxID=582686 RepID=A0A5S5BPW4_9BACL|nr:hypothetical protein [Paenibacillus methanolicus]TYP68378.1 hypothetical protein BCM02_11963 [Paenibacillus methanolicus]